MESPLVSVVTPVYNAEKYLAECIESVLSQTYENLEYIIVNNCSTDGSLNIINHYAQKDKRIRIVNNSLFLEQMPNRIQVYERGKLLPVTPQVVHADDWLFPECIEKMVGLAEKYPSVAIVSAYRIDEDRVNLDGLGGNCEILSGREACRQFFINNVYLFGSPTSLLLQSDIIRSRKKFYKEKNIHADQEICFDILRKSDFGFVHQVLTYTRRHNESNTTFTRFFNTYILGDITVLINYGSYFLDQEEYRNIYKKYFKIYYRILGRRIFRVRKKSSRKKVKSYFRYHKNAIESLNLSFSWPYLFISTLIVLYNELLTKLRIK